MSPDDPRHGTYAGFIQGCRNDCCREANRVYTRQRRARLRAVPLSPDSDLHGRTTTYYDYGCHCPKCREAVRAAKAAQFERRVAAAVALAVFRTATDRDRHLARRGMFP